MKTDYNKVVQRKDVTVKNMLNMYKSHPRFKSKITWDSFYLITGWKHIPNEKIKKSKTSQNKYGAYTLKT